MDKKLKIVGFGFLSWLIPFLASFFFFDVETQKFTIEFDNLFYSNKYKVFKHTNNFNWDRICVG